MRGVAAERSAQRACARSSDWRRGARSAPPTRISFRALQRPENSYAALEDELAGGGDVLGAVGQADAQRAIGLSAEDDHLLLAVDVGQAQALAAAPQAGLPHDSQLSL